LALSPESPDDGLQIETLLDRAFGADRLRKTSYRYRDGIPPLAELCFVAREAGKLVGSIRYWPIRLGDDDALLLGPLAIEPARQGRGIGRALTEATLGRAQAMGWRLVFLVGEPAYYARYGFRVAPGNVVMPGESPLRLQFRTLAGATLPAQGGVLSRYGVEPAEERLAQSAHAFVPGHAGLHLADPCGHGGGDAGPSPDFGQGSHESADGEDDRAALRQPPQRLPLDPQPELMPRVLGGQVGHALARLRVE
jgi:predicted N-acetyltransferase YhbS